jgi:hypothetical protein
MILGWAQIIEREGCVKTLCGRLACYSREEASRKWSIFVVEAVRAICCTGSRLRKTRRVSRGDLFWACKSGEREGRLGGEGEQHLTAQAAHGHVVHAVQEVPFGRPLTLFLTPLVPEMSVVL